MPYISINTTQELSADQKEKIKSELGRLMSIIPTKTEAGLLVDFSGGRTMYKAGAEVEGAFIDLKLYRKSELEPKKQFTAEVFSLLIRELALKKETMYLTIEEYENWGSNGELH
jgi:phenylpyruvate tautomerase PptA (4-oxalocrotonate tautomerase family)